MSVKMEKIHLHFGGFDIILEVAPRELGGMKV